MDIERIVQRAYETWKRHAGFLVLCGFLSYVFLAAIISPILLLGAKNPTNIYTFGILYIIGIVVQSAFLIAAAGAIADRQRITEVFAKRFLPVATSVLLVVLALLTGALISQMFIALSFSGIPGTDVVGALVFILFIYIAVKFSLAPYYALHSDWETAVKKSFDTTKKHIVSIASLEIFFALWSVFFLAIHPLVYIIVNAAFLAHIVNFSLLQIARSKR